MLLCSRLSWPTELAWRRVSRPGRVSQVKTNPSQSQTIYNRPLWNGDNKAWTWIKTKLSKRSSSGESEFGYNFCWWPTEHGRQLETYLSHTCDRISIWIYSQPSEKRLKSDVYISSIPFQKQFFWKLLPYKVTCCFICFFKYTKRITINFRKSLRPFILFLPLSNWFSRCQKIAHSTCCSFSWHSILYKFPKQSTQLIKYFKMTSTFEFTNKI